jgi:hypothetical protein
MALPHVFATAGGNLPSSWLDDNFNALAPLIDTTNYPLGSAAALALTAIAIANGVAKSDLTNVSEAQIFAAMTYKPTSIEGLEGVQNIDAIVYYEAIIEALGFTPMANSLGNVSPSIFYPPGVYNITANTTINANVAMLQGAIFNIATGVTLTITGDLSAPLTKIFNITGTGSVVLRVGQIGYPEWWGCQTNNILLDCLPFLIACYTACSVTILQPVIYYTSAVWNLTISNRVVQGTIKPTDGNCCEIQVKSGSADVIYVGLLSDPGSINSFAQNITIRNVLCSRDQAVVPPTAGSEATAPSGIKVRYLLYGLFEDCRQGGVYGHSTALNVESIVKCDFTRVSAFRSANGASATNDIFWCLALFAAGPYYLESLNFTDCSGAYGNTLDVSSIGIALSGAFTDISIQRPEYDLMTYGAFINQTSEGKPSIDSVITGGRFDQCRQFGFYVTAAESYSAIKIGDNYVEMNSAASGAAMEIASNGGIVSLNGNTCLGGGSTASGLVISGGSGGPSVVNSDGNTFTDFLNPIQISGAQNGRLNDTVHQTTQATAAAAITIGGSSRMVIDCTVYGDAAGLIAKGISLDSSSTYNEVRMSGVNPFALPSSASATKLVYNGANVTSAGAFGTGNIAQGIMA